MSQASDLQSRLRSLSIDRAERSRSGRSSFNRRPMWFALILIVTGGLGWIVLAHLSNGTAKQVTAMLSPVEQAQSVDAREAVTSVTSEHTRPLPDIPQISAPVTVVGSGYVVAPRSVVMKTEISGKITRVGVEVGDRVVSGTELAWLDPTEAQLALEIARSDAALTAVRVETARAELTAARAPLARYESLAPKGIVRKADLDDARNNVTTLSRVIEERRQELRTAELQVRKAQQTLDRHVLRAPFDAVVTDIALNEGAVVSSGEDGGAEETGILTLMDTHTLYVDVDVAERNIAEIAPGQMADVYLDAYPDRLLNAEVRLIEPSASRQKGTVTVRLQINNDETEGVLANMAAKVRFTGIHEMKLSATDLNRRN